MRTTMTIVTAAVLQMAASAQGAPGEASFDAAARWREIATRFRAACAERGAVGASLMFVRGGDEVGFAAFGAADQAAGRAVDRDTIYHWASCTKTLTGIAILQLRDRGRLRLDEPIVDFVPELRAAHDPLRVLGAIQLRHLMSHSAGFRGATWPWGGDRPWHPHEPTRWSQLVAMMPYTEIESTPGARFSYSNLGIVFLGRAIEALSGDDYEVYMEKNVLRPLGMARSYFDVTPYHLQRFRSHSYARAAGGALVDGGADFDTGITVSNGGLNAPLPDMARYLAFLLGAVPPDGDAARVLARASLQEMWQPVLPTGRDGDDHIGLCFFVQERGGQRFYTHTGGQHDFTTFFYVHPASNTGALGACNTANAGAVLTEFRTILMEQMSMPMANGGGDGESGDDGRAAGGDAEGVAFGECRLRIAGDAQAGRRLVVTVPSGGYEFTLDRAKLDGTMLDLECTLTRPARDLLVTQAFEDLEVAVAQAQLAGAASVRVLVSQQRGGEHYFVKPPYEPAATFALR